METPRIRALVSVPLEAAHVLVVAAAFVGFGVMVGGMPEHVPVHWGLHGPDRWGSPHEFWIFGGVLLLDLALLWGVLVATARRPPTAGPPGYAALEAKLRRLTVRGLESMFFGLDLLIGAAWLVIARASAAGSTRQVNLAVAGVVVGAIATILGSLAGYGRLGAAVQREMEALPGAPPSEHRLIYYAPDDPSVFVPKRSGVGSTLNFARPAAWVLLALFVGGPLVLVAVLLLAA
jgi:uncharacterized membrane protein